MDKILILGGGGFVGSHLAEEELKNGNTVTCVDVADSSKVAHLSGNNFCYMQCDIMKGSLGGLIAGHDIIYHLAAIADPSVYCIDPVKVLSVDLEMTQEIIKKCYLMKKKIIFASTSEIYGKNPNVPWSEDADRVLGPTYTPRWVYSTAKAMGEHYCYAYGKIGLKFVILRFFNFYGPRLDVIGQGRVIPCFLDKFLKGDDVEVVYPGTQTRCFTYIKDGVIGVRLAAHSESAEGKVFNIGTDHEISMMDLAVKMKDIGGFKSGIKIISAADKYGSGYDDIPRRAPVISCATKQLGWKPETTLEEGLKITIDYYKKEYENSNNAA